MNQATTRPIVTGPITGGRGRPFAASMLDVAAYGYTEAEYLLEGTATRYRLAPGAQLTRDGHWRVEPAGTAPFRTRMLVYRPNDARALQRHRGADVEQRHRRLRPVRRRESRVVRRRLRAGVPDDAEGGHRGTAAAAARARRMGSATLRHARRFRATTTRTTSSRRARWRSARIDRGEPVDPMAGLDGAAGRRARRIAVGRTPRHVRQRDSAADAARSTVSFCRSTSVRAARSKSATPSSTSTRRRRCAPGDRMRGSNLLRDDNGVPVFVVNSELEAIACHPVRQPDTRHVPLLGIRRHLSRVGAGPGAIVRTS